MRILGFTLACCLLPTLLLAGVAGSFRGVIVTLQADGQGSWMYVQGKNQRLRKVEISRAKIVFAEGIPRERQNEGDKVLQSGVEVRVTAEQDQAGEWSAREIEILQLPAGKEPESPAKKLFLPSTDRSSSTSKQY